MNPNQSTETSIDNLEFQIAGLKDEIERNEKAIMRTTDQQTIILLREDIRINHKKIVELEAQKLIIEGLKV